MPTTDPRASPKTGPKIGPGLGPRPSAGLSLSVSQTIALLGLPVAALTGRLALAAAENPALRLVPPKEAGWLAPSLDPEGLSAPGGSLIAHVLGEIGALDLAPRQAAIALVLCEALEPTGWLGRPLRLIARDCAAPEAEVLEVLGTLQRIEPGGLFARSLAECLALQAAQAGELDAALAALLGELPLLASGGLEAVAGATGLPPEALRQAAARLRSYDPKPGLAFAGPVLPAPPADLLLREGPGGWEAVPNPNLFRLDCLPGQEGSAAAAALARALAGRGRIAAGIGTLLAQRQSAWLSGGAPQPVTARELAGASGYHLATVNRCLTAITARMPGGTRPLRSLISHAAGPDGAAAARIRARLAELLAEPGAARLPDAALAARLASEGLGIARRTVAKYRAALG